MVVIIDYGAGNIGSLLNMIRKVGGNAIVSSSKKDIESAESLILPGVGAFDHVANNLKNSGLLPVSYTHLTLPTKA